MIDYMAEGVQLPSLDYARVGRWIEQVASDHGKRVGNITYCFCDDKYILESNVKFLGHDYYTDIITFDYSRHDKIGGDILISLDTVASNAETVGATYDSELMRVIIHGVLHLCGIGDKGPGERVIMEREEDNALAIWNGMK